MRFRNRATTVFFTAAYVLAVSGSALFHDHSSCDHGDDDHARAGVSASHLSEAHDCSVCQFMGQKQAPVDEVVAVVSAPLVQRIVGSSPLDVEAVVFSAWRSRAPPMSA